MGRIKIIDHQAMVEDEQRPTALPVSLAFRLCSKFFAEIQVRTYYHVSSKRNSPGGGVKLDLKPLVEFFEQTSTDVICLNITFYSWCKDKL